MDRRKFLQAGVALGAIASRGASASRALPNSMQSDRDYWVQSMLKIADPVLHALSEGKLRERMPVDAPHGNLEDRKQFTYLEAIGRLLAGMAPWLESNDGSEDTLRTQYAELSRSAIRSATDPDSPDFMNFNKGSQPVVDTRLSFSCNRSCAQRAVAQAGSQDSTERDRCCAVFASDTSWIFQLASLLRDE
jgi:hypothetical protein